jgi:hypothetical protein
MATKVKKLPHQTDQQNRALMSAVWSLNSARDAVAADITPAQLARINATRDLLFSLAGGTD